MRTPQCGGAFQVRLFRYRLETAGLLVIVHGREEGAETVPKLHPPADGSEIRDVLTRATARCRLAVLPTVAEHQDS